jgi:L-ascorbate metabolism protein UlaG (beta-lactamase superfamily)
MQKINEYYIRQDVYVEPLINSWYAWPNLIAPFTYSMYMSKTHRRLMKSFIDNHELHVIARQDSSLANVGEFVAYDSQQVEEVRNLFHNLETEHTQYFKLAQAIKELDNLVRNHRSGKSIEPLYEKVPQLLKGYVELFMDLYHQPSYRLIEGLIYRSDYYKTQLQSVNLGILEKGTDRPSVISTPRLVNEDVINIKVPFESELWDRIFQAREYPVSKSQINQIFNGVPISGGLNPKSIFTSKAPVSNYKKISNKDVRLQYIGHAGLLIESVKIRILVDPIIAYRTDDISDKVISFSDISGKIDYVCLTHNHSDHINIETLLQLRYKINKVLVPKNNGGTLADPSLKLLLKKLNFDVHEMDDLEEIYFEGGRLVSIPFLGEHGDLNIRSKTAWFFELYGKKIYAGADSSNLDIYMFKHIYKITQDLDVLAVGMECVGAPYTWLYGALTTEPVSKEISQSRRLNGADFEKTKSMVKLFHPNQVLIYALGIEPWYQYLIGVSYSEHAQQIVESNKLIEYCKKLDIPASRLEKKHEIIL